MKLATIYSKVIKYNSSPLKEPGFEAAIDADPTEATTHLAYADWLDDNNQPEEAAFRRSLGNWIDKNRSSFRGRDEDVGEVAAGKWYAPGYGVGGKLGYPEGINLDIFDFPKNANGVILSYPSPGSEEYSPSARRSDNDHPKEPYYLRWDNYRDFEEALRRAFRNRKNK